MSLSLISEIKYYREDFKNLIKINLGDNYNIDQLFLPILLSIDKNLKMSYL